MIEIKSVIEFFDRLAPTWDSDMVRDETVIDHILDLAGIGPGKEILDVGSGTGVLIPDYLKRGACHVTAIDISPKMIEIASEKFNGDDRVSFICGNAQIMDLSQMFDCILIYNAFPHFSEPQRLLMNLSRQLKKGGRLTVAHGMSRERINEHHRGGASHVSYGLMPAEELARLFAPYLSADEIISDERMYLVSGMAEPR